MCVQFCVCLCVCPSSPPSSHGHQVAIEGLVLSAQLSPVATLELIAAVLQVRSRR